MSINYTGNLKVNESADQISPGSVVRLATPNTMNMFKPFSEPHCTPEQEHQEIKSEINKFFQRNRARTDVIEAAIRLTQTCEEAHEYLTPSDKRELKQLLSSIIDIL